MAALIPQNIIDDIMEQTEIVELVSSYIPLVRRGKNHIALCPFHNEDTPSFTVSQDKQIFYCFGCQKGGNVINFVMEMDSLSYPEALRKLAERLHIEIPENISPRQKEALGERQLNLRLHQLTSEFYQKCLASNPAIKDYALKRGLDSNLCHTFGLGYAPSDDWQALYNYLSKQGYQGDSMEKAGLVSQSSKNNKYYDKFRGRLIFPIGDFRGQVIAFGGRIIGDEQPKYLNSAQTAIYNKSQNLYALHIAAAHIRRLNQAIIMEGYIDVLIAHQHGLNNAVATLGTALTADHARLLKRYTENVILAYDGDEAGQKAAQKGLEVLSDQGLRVKIVVLPKGMDPDDFLRAKGLNGWQDLVAKEGYEMLDYLLNLALTNHDAQTATGKGAIVSELLPIIAKINSHVVRESFIRRLAESLHVSAQTIYADLQKSGLKISQYKPNIGHLEQTQTPLAARKHDSRRQLLVLAMAEQKIFELAKNELNQNFGQNEEDCQLIALINQLGSDYDYKPSSLLNHIPSENEGLRQYLLKLLRIDISDADNLKWAKQLIPIIKQEIIREKILKINQEITKQTDLETIRNLLAEKQALTESLQSI